MKFRAFGTTFDSGFETLFPDSTDEATEVIDRISSFELRGELIHDAHDFEAGPRLQVFDDPTFRTIRYRDFTARISAGAIQVAHDGDDIGWITRVFERVILPIAMLYWNSDWFALHGSAVSTDRATLFCGESHAGKSTAALEMMQRGARLITDDLALIDGNHHVSGAAATLRSWDAIDRRHVSFDDLVAPETTKRWYRFDDTVAQLHPTPLKQIVVLSIDETFRFTPLLGAQRAAAILNQTFGFTAEPPTDRAARFAAVTALVRDTDIFSCTIPKSDDRQAYYDELWSHL